MADLNRFEAFWAGSVREAASDLAQVRKPSGRKPWTRVEEEARSSFAEQIEGISGASLSDTKHGQSIQLTEGRNRRLQELRRRTMAVFGVLGLKPTADGWRTLALWLLANTGEPGSTRDGSGLAGKIIALRQPAPPKPDGSVHAPAAHLQEAMRLVEHLSSADASADRMSKAQAISVAVKRQNREVATLDEHFPLDRPRKRITEAALAQELKRSRRLEKVLPHPLDDPAISSVREADEWLAFLREAAPRYETWVDEMQDALERARCGSHSIEECRRYAMRAVDRAFAELEVGTNR